MIKQFEYKILFNTDFINKAELFGIVSKVGNSVINSIKNDIYKLFFSQEDKKMLFNDQFEIFVKEKVLCIMDFERSDSITLSFITYSDDYEKIVEMFKRVIEKYLQTKNIEYRIVENKVEFSLFYPVDPSSFSSYNFEIFSKIDSYKYNVLKNIGNLGNKMYKREISKFLQLDSKVIDDLIDIGLLQREYVFICKENGRQIIQLANLDILNTNPDAIKCFYCGKNLRDEVMEEVISLSSLASDIIKDNLWIAGIVHKALVENGVSNVLIDSVELGKVIICNHLYEPVAIFILKEDFKIHNVFLLDIYLSNYKTKYVILFSISPNLVIVRDYISQKGIRVILIDSYENIYQNVVNSVEEMSRILIKDKLENYNKYFNFRISDLLYSGSTLVESST